MDEHVEDAPVLVAGAGPAGLTTAVALARRGIEVLLVERRAELSRLPRATVISTRSMELLRSWSLDAAVRAGGVDVAWQQLVCETLAQASAGTAFDVGLPSRAQSAMVSPMAPECVPQDHLEPVLLDQLDAARVEFGTEVVDIAECPDGVSAVLRRIDTGVTRTVHAQYVVAGDGARSTIRNALGIPMHGPDQLLGATTCLFRAPLWDLLGERRYGLYAITHPDAEGLFPPAGRGDRWLYGCEPAGDDGRSHTEERMTDLIRRASGVPGLAPEIERIGSFSFAAQLAPRFRKGRVFLVDDAAHRVTPRGGTGMNSAIHDGYDLGWKLGWVLCGWGAPSLLDSYESERRPVVEHNLARSADLDGEHWPVEDELRFDLDTASRTSGCRRPATVRSRWTSSGQGSRC